MTPARYARIARRAAPWRAHLWIICVALLVVPALAAGFSALEGHSIAATSRWWAIPAAGIPIGGWAFWMLVVVRWFGGTVTVRAERSVLGRGLLWFEAVVCNALALGGVAIGCGWWKIAWASAAIPSP